MVRMQRRAGSDKGDADNANESDRPSRKNNIYLWKPKEIFVLHVVEKVGVRRRLLEYHENCCAKM